MSTKFELKMKIKTYIAVLFFAVATAFQVNAQVKIGYTNVEFVLAYMPEFKSMQKELETYQGQLAKRLKVKDDYVKQKYQEYLTLKEQGATEARLKPMEEELLKLDQEVQQLAAKSEEELVNKQQALLEPVLKKLQDAIDDIAATKGYEYILNQTTSAGVSTILFGPEEADITKDLFTKLGMKMPAE